MIHLRKLSILIFCIILLVSLVYADEIIYGDLYVEDGVYAENVTSRSGLYCNGTDCHTFADLISDNDTTYTADEGNITLVGTVFYLLRLDLAEFNNSLSWITNAVSNLINYPLTSYVISMISGNRTESEAVLRDNIDKNSTADRTYTDVRVDSIDNHTATVDTTIGNESVKVALIIETYIPDNSTADRGYTDTRVDSIVNLTETDVEGFFSSGDGNITYLNGVYTLIKLNLEQFTHPGWITAAVAALDNFFTKTETGILLADINNTIDTKLDITDQRYNDTDYIDAVNDSDNINNLFPFNDLTTDDTTIYDDTSVRQSIEDNQTETLGIVRDWNDENSTADREYTDIRVDSIDNHTATIDTTIGNETVRVDLIIGTYIPDNSTTNRAYTDTRVDSIDNHTATIDSNASTGCPAGTFLEGNSGACIDYNATIDYKLAGNIYNASVNWTEFGTPSSVPENNINLTWYYDGQSYNITLESGSNGLAHYMNFTASDINRLCFRTRLLSPTPTSLAVQVDLWDLSLNDWESYGDVIIAASDFEVQCLDILDGADHIINGEVPVKFISVGTSKTTQKFMIDFVWVLDGYTPIAGTEGDPHSWHIDGDNILVNDISAGGYTIYNVNINGTWNGSVNYYTITQIDNDTIVRSQNTSWVNDLIDIRVDLSFLQNLLDSIYATITNVQSWISTNKTDTETILRNNIDTNYTQLNNRDNAINTSTNINALFTDDLTTDDDTTYTADEGNLTLVGTVFYLLKVNLAELDNSISLFITKGVSNLDNYFTKTQSDLHYWNESNDIDNDEIAEAKINFVTSCSAGDYYRLTGNDLECTTPIDTDTQINNCSVDLSCDATLLYESELNSLAEFDTQIGIGGTPSSSTFWRGDNSWETPTDTTYTNGSGLTLVGTEFNHSDTSSQASDDNSGNTFIQDILLDGLGHITSITNAAVSFASYWDTSNDIDTVISADEIAEIKIEFTTACAAGNHYYKSGNDLACEADDDTTYSAGNGISLSTTTFSVAGGDGLTQEVSGLKVTVDGIGDTQLAYDTGQALTTSDTPTFAGVTLTNTLDVSTNFRVTDTNLTCFNADCTWFANASDNCLYWKSGGRECST